jgi:hypothetical protein
MNEKTKWMKKTNEWSNFKSNFFSIEVMNNKFSEQLERKKRNALKLCEFLDQKFFFITIFIIFIIKQYQTNSILVLKFFPTSILRKIVN